MLRYNTKESNYAIIQEMAKEVFADHKIHIEQGTGPVRMWHCHNGKRAYSFRVVSGPGGFLAVYGDVGDRILSVSASDTVAWICNAHESNDYIISKMLHKSKCFVEYAAEQLLNYLRNEAEDDEQKNFVEKVNDAWCRDNDSGYNFAEAYTNAGGEAEDILMAYDWDSDVYWTLMCLKKFVELYIAGEQDDDHTSI